MDHPVLTHNASDDPDERSWEHSSGLPVPMHSLNVNAQDQMPGLLKDGRQLRKVNQTADDKVRSQRNVGS